MAREGLLARLGIEHPILLAPMAGGPGTPELVAAVSDAGGLGSLGAAYLAPDRIAEAIRRIRALTDRPFAVNLFAGGREPAGRRDLAPMLAILSEIHAEYGLPPPTVPVLPPDPFPAELEAVIEARPAAFSFTFGIPAARDLEQVRAAGIAVLGTATTVEEARLVERAGRMLAACATRIG